MENLWLQVFFGSRNFFVRIFGARNFFMGIFDFRNSFVEFLAPRIFLEILTLEIVFVGILGSRNFFMGNFRGSKIFSPDN